MRFNPAGRFSLITVVAYVPLPPVTLSVLGYCAAFFPALTYKSNAGTVSGLRTVIVDDAANTESYSDGSLSVA